MPGELEIESTKDGQSPPVTQNRSSTKSPAAKLDATRYVGRPAVGTSKAAPAGGIPSAGPPDTEPNRGRRRFAWSLHCRFSGRMVHRIFQIFHAASFVRTSHCF